MEESKINLLNFDSFEIIGGFGEGFKIFYKSI